MRTNQWPLVLTSCLITAGFLLLTFSQWPGSECHVLSEWWSARQANSLYANASLEQPSSDPLALAQLGSVTYHALRESGWRSGVFYARFSTIALQDILTAPFHYTGALVLIVPGDSPPARRGSQPFLSVDPSAGNLSSVVPVAAINSAVQVVEAARGRQLFAFRLETFPFKTCRSGDGPCAVWEVSSGRLLLDADLASQLGSVPQLHSLLAQFGGELLGQVQAAAAKLAPGQATVAALSNLFASAGPAALAAIMVAGASAGALPLWFCIACPTILGLLAPFALNFGLTAAAEQVCQHFQLPNDQCTDLWWGAFALALIMSLGSAIPIVYVCRLPECMKHLIKPSLV